jgi:hypothetical protein
VLRCDGCCPVSRSQETTLVHHAFAGYMRNQVVCGGCGAASRRFEVALDLTLALQGADSLEDALAQFTAGAQP